MSRAGPGLGLHKGRICLLVNPASVISPLTIQATPPPPHQATWATFIPPTPYKAPTVISCLLPNLGLSSAPQGLLPPTDSASLEPPDLSHPSTTLWPN